MHEGLKLDIGRYYDFFGKIDAARRQFVICDLGILRYFLHESCVIFTFLHYWIYAMNNLYHYRYEALLVIEDKL
jgi:hypothetical protein